MSTLAKYLIGTTLAGGAVGVVHGVITLPPPTVLPNPSARVLHVALQAQIGTVVGAWAPVLGGLVLQGTLRREHLMNMNPRARQCPFVQPPGPPPVGADMPDLPTVAEAR